MSFLYLIELCVVTLMRKVALFVEDWAHRQVIGAIVNRIAEENSLQIELDWRNSVRGFSKVASEFKRYIKDIEGLVGDRPDLIIVASDAHCKGFNSRSKELQIQNSYAPVIQAIPDPHIERWLLLDGAAFKSVFEIGCDAPDLKCDRSRYKNLLTSAIKKANVNPSLGGIEFSKDIVNNIDIRRAARADDSFKRFVEQVLAIFRQWKS